MLFLPHYLPLWLPLFSPIPHYSLQDIHSEARISSRNHPCTPLSLGCCGDSQPYLCCIWVSSTHHETITWAMEKEGEGIIVCCEPWKGCLLDKTWLLHSWIHVGVVTCTRQNHLKFWHSGSSATEIESLTEELMTADGCWKSHFSLGGVLILVGCSYCNEWPHPMQISASRTGLSV